MEHEGSRACYVKGCRLPQCKEANNEYMRVYRGNGKRREPRHGTRSMYNKGCREECCMAANRDYQRHRQQVLRGTQVPLEPDPTYGGIIPA